MSLGVVGTYNKVMSANGPAQMLTYAFWGVLMAGMFHGVCEMCIPNWLLICWALSSALVVPCTVWLSRAHLRNALLLDVVISAYILVVFFMHEPHTTEFVYYSFGVDQMTSREMSGHGPLSEWFHIAALVWMTFHGMYLADLTHRQILETKRFAQ